MQCVVKRIIPGVELIQMMSREVSRAGTTALNHTQMLNLVRFANLVQ